MKLLIFIAQLLVLILCILYINIIYKNYIYPDEVVSDIYPTTQCRVVEKTLSTAGTLVMRYRADFLLAYNINGISYREWTSGNGLDRSFVSNYEAEEKTLKQFNIGSEYTCWYSPSAPKIVVLVLRDDWSSTFPLFIPTVIGLVMGYYLLRSILEVLIGMIMRERR